MSKIEELYYDFINTDRLQEDRDSRLALDRFEELLKQNVADEKKQSTLCDACANYGSESERQGFVYGFTYAMQIASECFAKS